mgnify:CR=1
MPAWCHIQVVQFYGGSYLIDKLWKLSLIYHGTRWNDVDADIGAGRAWLEVQQLTPSYTIPLFD